MKGKIVLTCYSSLNESTKPKWFHERYQLGSQLRWMSVRGIDQRLIN